MSKSAGSKEKKESGSKASAVSTAVVKARKGSEGAGGGGSVIDEWGVGREPLKNDKHERWCQAVCGGEDELEAYYRIWKDELGLKRSKKSTAKSTKSKIRRQKDVAARLKWLRQENACKAKLGREEKLRITEEVIAGLREDFRKGERGKTVNDLMSALQRHDAMTGEGEKPTLEIKLNFGGLIEGVEKLVEKRLGIEEGGKTLTGAVSGMKEAEGEVVEV